MAENETKEQKSSTSKKTESKNHIQWKATLVDLGMHVLTGFLSGLTLAAGNHAYQMMVRGKQSSVDDTNVVPLRKHG